MVYGLGFGNLWARAEMAAVCCARWKRASSRASASGLRCRHVVSTRRSLLTCSYVSFDMFIGLF